MSHVETLPFDAPINDYEAQAAALLDDFRAGSRAAHEAFKWQHPRFRGRPLSEVPGADLGIDDARIVVAHCWAFDTWGALARYAAAVGEDGPVRRFEQAAEAVVTGDASALRRILEKHPELARERSARRHHATLLHYVAANGVEGARQRTPPNAVEVTRVLLDAGAEPDALADMYEHKCTTMSMLVSSDHPAEAGLTSELVRLLIERGAKWVGPGSAWQSAVHTALLFGFAEVAQELVRSGAPVEDLPTAAGLGRTDDVTRLLPGAGAPERHAALSLAAQLGRAEVVRAMLDAGEDPSRFNPDGYHAHATPLHQAALAGHLDTAQILVERGARLDIQDAIYEGTPLAWAEYGGQREVAEYLRARGST